VSRSLGRLLGLASLVFKLECRQPSGSWLDRSADAIVASAVAAGRTGLCTVGPDAWTLPLAMRCARAGLRVVVLEPTVDVAADAGPRRSDERAWLSALGVRTVTIEADARAVRAATPGVAAGAGLFWVAPDDPSLDLGLAAAVDEVERAGHADALLALPELTGREARWLARGIRLFPAVVGRLEGATACPADHDPSLVVSIAVSVREADAARRLLAREEGLLVSRVGASGLAGLVRALREDRARRPREKRLRGATSAAVILAGGPVWADEAPPPEPDAVPLRPVPLASLTADLARLLVGPPGRR